MVSSGPDAVEVPDVTGRSLEEAGEGLADAGLELGEVTREPSEEFDEGEVMSQSIEPSSEVDAGSAVDVVVSSGPETVEVPDVEGLEEDEAIDEIESARLDAKVRRAGGGDEAGVVLSQDPAPGTELEAGDDVTIVVSEGPQTTELDDVTGLNANQASAILEDSGLEVVEADARGPCKVPPNSVCDQDPSPGTEVAPGDTVTLYVRPPGK